MLARVRDVDVVAGVLLEVATCLLAQRSVDPSHYYEYGRRVALRRVRRHGREAVEFAHHETRCAHADNLRAVCGPPGGRYLVTAVVDDLQLKTLALVDDGCGFAAWA